MNLTSPISRYSYISAKLRSKVGSMLTSDQIQTLLRSKSVDQVLHYLEHTAYRPLIELYKNYGDVQILEAYLFKKHVAMYKEVSKSFDSTYTSYIEAMSRKAEVENLKGLIRLYFSNTIKKQNIDYRLSYLYQDRIVDEIDYLKIANASSFDDVKEALSKSLYYEALLPFNDELLAHEGLFSLEVALDQAWRKNLRNHIKPLAKQDRLIIEEVLKNDADLKNIINLFRYSHLYHLENEELEKIMIRNGTLINSPQYASFLKSDASKRSIEMLLEKDYKALLSLIKENAHQPIKQQILIVEKYLFSIRKKEFHTLLRGNPFSIGIVLSYFFLEERQDHLVRSIINGVHYGLDASTIREFII